MLKTLGTQFKAAACLAAGLIFMQGTAAHADEVLAARLSALLGQERTAIRQVPDARLAALTALPPASARNIATAPDVLTYDNAFLASQPAAGGKSCRLGSGAVPLFPKSINQEPLSNSVLPP